MRSFLFRAACSAFVALTLAACGGGGSGGGSGGGDGGGGAGPSSADPPPSPAPPAPTNAPLTGVHVTKLRAQGSAWLALASKPRPHQDNTAPDRTLLMTAAGSAAGAPAREYRPPAGWSLIDAALHPSGEASVVLATARRLRLLRLSTQAQVLSDAELADPQIARDPVFEEGSFAHDAGSMLPMVTRDAVRIAASGESLVMALRTGRHAVVAYGLRESRPQGYAIAWRTVVEPGVYIIAEQFLGGGTFDPFEGMENQFHVALDVDAGGRIGIAVAISRTELVDGHNWLYPGSLPSALANGVLLTQLTAAGERLSTVAVDTREMSELHGLRWVGQRLALVGRVRTDRRADGSGWDAFIALVTRGSNPQSSYTVIDTDRGDVVFDAVQRADGRLVLAGSTGYSQNPNGRSISEDAAPLLLVTAADGSNARRQPSAAGPRHNQVRALIQWAGSTWAGGMEDGPGTHSDDADPSRLRSSGYVRAAALAD